MKFCKGTRSSVKRRSIIGKFVQYLLAKFGSNSWLEVVAINKVAFEKNLIKELSEVTHDFN